MNTTPFIEALVQARKAKGMSQATLGRYLGLPQSHISKLERGLAEPRLSNFIDMARLLGLEPILTPAPMAHIVHALIRGETLKPGVPLWRPDEDEDLP